MTTRTQYYEFANPVMFQIMDLAYEFNLRNQIDLLV